MNPICSQVDHLVVGARELDAAVAWLEDLTGIRAAIGGSHPGRGTRNALIGCGGRSYLELLAPDAAQASDNAFCQMLRSFETPTLFAYMLPSQGLDELAAVFQTTGVPASLQEASRTLPDGRELAWRLLIPGASAWGDTLPKYIDWGDAPHPSERAPTGCELVSLEIEHPQDTRLAELWQQLHMPLPLRPNAVPGMRARLATPRGLVEIGGRAGG